MKAHVGIAKRKAKTLAGAAIVHSEDLGMWHVFLYSVMNNIAAPFSEDTFESFEEASSHTCETLKIEATELIQLDEDEVESYILANTRNKRSSP
jgi:hypothetical protein